MALLTRQVPNPIIGISTSLFNFVVGIGIFRDLAFDFLLKNSKFVWFARKRPNGALFSTISLQKVAKQLKAKSKCVLRSFLLLMNFTQ